MTPSKIAELRRLAKAVRNARAAYRTGGSIDKLAFAEERLQGLGDPEDTILALLDALEDKG